MASAGGNSQSGKDSDAKDGDCEACSLAPLHVELRGSCLGVALEHAYLGVDDLIRRAEHNFFLSGRLRGDRTVPSRIGVEGPKPTFRLF